MNLPGARQPVRAGRPPEWGSSIPRSPEGWASEPACARLRFETEPSTAGSRRRVVGITGGALAPNRPAGG